MDSCYTESGCDECEGTGRITVAADYCYCQRVTADNPTGKADPGCSECQGSGCPDVKGPCPVCDGTGIIGYYVPPLL